MAGPLLSFQGIRPVRRAQLTAAAAAAVAALAAPREVAAPVAGVSSRARRAMPPKRIAVLRNRLLPSTGHRPHPMLSSAGRAGNSGSTSDRLLAGTVATKGGRWTPTS